ncbi:hypothetical protein GPECTOR_20g425 [Gonium pectorale]|uniref:Uncharacterized protein n=1 Tax=Gonium pectorale TaxID=33097 RepID=A0A150GJD4_GONPE|nr:hypothetical protein GPECTOR_20g425 [Gonium pectorale]|eukprot:KXZ49570.1 hypothetical protein GPECTOR_20g425 [Gonium pectorale]
MIQYFNRPWMLPALVAPFRRCVDPGWNLTSDSADAHEGAAGGSGSPLPFGLELLVNVDSRVDAAEVAAFAAGLLGSSGFVKLVYSNNVHEIRSYNRLAQLARGKILDDDVFREEVACVWLASVVRAFRRWPRLGAIGSQRYIFDYHPNTTQEGVHFWDPGAGAVRLGARGGGGGGRAGEGNGSGGEEASGDGGGGGGAAGADVAGGVDRGKEAGGHRRRRQLRESGGGDAVDGGGDMSTNGDGAASDVAQATEGHAADPETGRKDGGEGGDGSGESTGESASVEAEQEEEEEEVPFRFEDDGRLRMQFVSLVDYAPLAVRASAFAAVGGIDGGMSESGQCGVHSDYDLALRLWLAGWQVAYIGAPGLSKDPREEEGGTHRKGVAGYCWERQWEQAIGYMRQRWGQRNRWDPESYYWYGSNLFEVVAEHVRQLNLRLLQPLTEPPDSYCPFGYGCEEAPADRISGEPRPVSPLFGNLSSWPKHVRAAWARDRALSRRGVSIAALVPGRGTVEGTQTRAREDGVATG